MVSALLGEAYLVEPFGLLGDRSHSQRGNIRVKGVVKAHNSERGPKLAIKSLRSNQT
jgi:hypothetical protein